MSTPEARRAPARPPSGQAQQAPPTDFGTAAAVGAVGGPVGGAAVTAGALASVAPAVAALLLAGKSIAAILKVLAKFFLISRARHAWLIMRLGRESKMRRKPRQGARWPETSIEELITEENARQAEFERRARKRVTKDAGEALKLPDRPIPLPKPAVDADGEAKTSRKRPKKTPAPGEPGSGISPRQAALDKAARREQFYERLRQEAIFNRTRAAIERVAVLADDPEGAVWLLGQHVQKHTPDCIAAAAVGYWPWEALAIYHPVAHVGCQCRLESRKAALAAGVWTPPAKPMTIAQAVTRMQAIKAMGHEH